MKTARMAHRRILTQRIKAAAELVGVTYLDHIIIGESGRYYAFSTQTHATL